MNAMLITLILQPCYCLFRWRDASFFKIYFEFL